MLAALVEFMKRIGPRYSAAWIGLCFATALVLHAAWGIELDKDKPALSGMAIFWAVVLIGLALLTRRKRSRAARNGGTGPGVPS